MPSAGTVSSQPTKEYKGFQPLQMNWGRLIIDAVFHGGDKHSNHGHTVEQMIRHMAVLIRKKYRPGYCSYHPDGQRLF